MPVFVRRRKLQHVHCIIFNTMIKFCSSCIIILIALTPSAILQENINHKSWNSDNFKECNCNYTLDFVPNCENQNFTYNRKEIYDCIETCSKNSESIKLSIQKSFQITYTVRMGTLNVIHNLECPRESEEKLLFKLKKNCSDCKLTNDFAPVCGNDGITYPNPSYLFCVADCEKPVLQYSYCGFCLSQLDKQKPMEYDIMMDENSKNSSKDLINSLATCDCVLKYNLNPICGDDELTYPNPSMLYCMKKCRKADLQIKSCGQCLTKISKNTNELETAVRIQYQETDEKKYKCDCIKEYNPVCGSNGITYANPSTLFCAEKYFKSDLKLSYCGKCETQKELMSEQYKVSIPDVMVETFDSCGCIFTKEYEPVCGSDGKVYDNPSIFYCTRKCMHLDIIIKNCGDCEKMDHESSLKKSIQQNHKDLKLLSNAYLKCDCVATSTLYPVCGSDGVTYPHLSYIYCIKNCKAHDILFDNLQMAYCGPCKDEKVELSTFDLNQDKLSTEYLEIFEKCKCKITEEWNPVCGTNNITYNNPSVLYCSNKCINSSINIDHCGSCQDQEKDNPRPLNINNDDTNKCQCSATREYNPVCGSDGNNYANLIVFECIKHCTNQNISIAYDGLCSDKNEDTFVTYNQNTLRTRFNESVQGVDTLLGCNCVIRTHYAPVCGTDGKTYPNLSHLSCNNRCYHRRVYIDHYGPCNDTVKQPAVKNFCKCDVTYEYRPVCGSDGETYPNDQQLKCANTCNYKNTHKVHDGPCNQPEKSEEPLKSQICNCDISEQREPLCASDGKDYINLSDLHCHNQCNNTNVYKVYDGPCQYPGKARNYEEN